MTGRTVLVIGGARSGKSRYAERLAAGLAAETIFVATAHAGDEEMRDRIRAHRQARPPGFRTLEVEKGIASALAPVITPDNVVLIDCLTLLVANLLGDGDPGFETRAENEIGALLDVITRRAASFIIVSSEVGLGIVPETAVVRRYRDALGTANQHVAQAADEVHFVVAGQPLRVK